MVLMSRVMKIARARKPGANYGECTFIWKNLWVRGGG